MLEQASLPRPVRRCLDRVPGWAAPLGAGALAIAAVGYVAAVDPNQPGHYPTCPFLALTGWYCPGCGSLRAVHALAHGDVAAAFGSNPLTVAMLPFLVLGWALWLRRTATGRQLNRVVPASAIWVLLASIIVFWVARNLPGFGFLAP